MSTQDEKTSRVLIVEDEMIVAADLETSLRDLGFDVVGIAGDVTDALAIASRERPDLVLMDIQLHGKPAGVEAADAIRRHWNIPVVFLTAYTSEEVMQRARAAGAYGFLSKPFRIEDLKAAILIALQQHRLGQELFAEHNWLVTMLASLSDGVIAADASGSVRYINPAAEAMTKWSSAQAMGKAIEEVYLLRHIDGSRVPHCQLRRALATKMSVPKERFLMQGKDEERIPVEDAAAPIIEAGHLLGAVTIFLDISARLKAETEQQQEQGRLEHEVKATSAALGHTKEELRALSGRLITAQEDERRRVARELHDDLGQRTALMGWRVAEMRRVAGGLPAKMEREVDQLLEDLNYLSTGLRQVSHQLHPATIADLGLPTALRELVDQQRKQGLEVSLAARELPSGIPSTVGTALYRIAQEALRNALQHAAGAPVLISLSATGGSVEMTIEDPGPGFDLDRVRQTGGLGLLSMQERARLLGGTLNIRTAPEQGTRVSVDVPLELQPDLVESSANGAS